MTMPSDDHMSRTDASRARRIEVFTGVGRRRDWADEEKASIIAESYRSGNVSAVARRHGLTPTQLFTWRRTARPDGGAALETAPEFVPAVMEASTSNEPERQARDADPVIGFELAGANVWICPGADAGMVTTIIRALKATR